MDSSGPVVTPGIYVPLITPFDDTGGVCLGSLMRLAHEVLDDGATGLVALGTTAEAATLTGSERSDVVDVAARVCRERGAPLIVGAGGNDTAASADSLASLARVPEVVAALTLVPYFTRPSEDGVVAHFRMLAARSPVPLVVYHVPYRTGRDLSVRTLRALASLPGIVGIKYAAGGITADTVQFLAAPPQDFTILGGDDVVVSPLLAMGAHGGILASAHVATRSFADLADAWRTGDVERGRRLGNLLAGVSAALFSEPNPTVIKGVLYAQGRIPTPRVRLPLLPATTDAVSEATRLCGDQRDGASGRYPGLRPAGGGRVVDVAVVLLCRRRRSTGTGDAARRNSAWGYPAMIR
jgi:4-hydroxy-tetrahydrodipicolinate synthase